MRTKLIKTMDDLAKTLVILLAGLFLTVGCSTQIQNESLQTALKNKFLIGVAMNEAQINGTDTAAVELILKHFNSVVAENCMKSESIQPKEGEFDFTLADSFVDFGEKHGMYIVGHVLIWHSQAPEWFFTDNEGNDVSREVLLDRMKNHINVLVTRYKGRVDCWDVVNEAFLDDGSWRENKFYEIIGKDYVNHAFRFAHEADPEAELLYNDYSMAHEGRRNSVVEMVRELKNEGIPIDGIGMQAHSQMDFPPIDEFEKSIESFAAAGVDVHITEMDISTLPSPWNFNGADVAANFDYEAYMNPYANGLPDSAKIALQNRYMDFFNLFLKHQDKIKRVTMWGLTDADSWKNNWPIKGRTDYPLLFDRNYKPKETVNKIIEAATAQ